jgi:dihydrofolate reductase
MARLIGSLSMSLDGYIAHHDDTVGPLFDWYDAGDVEVATARPDMTWHVDEASAALLRELMTEVKALFIGRRFFEMMDGWGAQHPFGFGIPIIVPVTAVPDGWPRADRPDVIFVTDGLEAAVAKAHEIAGDGIVGVSGPRTIQAVLEAGLLDELAIALVPVLLGDGIRYFDEVATAPVLLDDPEVRLGKRVTHLRYRVRRRTP